MCGIAGAINLKLDYEKINKAMLHRGPDAQHGYKIDNVDLYHLRLSILDIAGGVQPMHLRERYTIIFNGEIYNHEELRGKYKLKGSSSSDTETLLLLYELLGIKMLEELDGMFAFALYDRNEKKLVLARDRAGKKPLYIYRKGNEIVFASELNALRSQCDLGLNREHFYTYLRNGTFYNKQTPYNNVEELEAGTYWEINTTNLDTKKVKWWDIADFYAQKSGDKLQQALEKTDSYLHQGVKRRIISSDLEVGSFLSGGIDSGLVTAIASEYNSKLKTFTVSFEGEYDEAPLARMVAEKYNTTHTEINISFDNLQQDLEKIISNYGEPFFDSSAIPSYYVSEEAKKYVTVILNGDGADELFAGYRRYVPFAKYDFFKSPAALKGLAKLGTGILPASDNKKSKYNYIYRLLSFAGKKNLEMYLSAGVDIFEDFDSHIIGSKEKDYLQELRADFEKVASQKISGLRKVMQLDFKVNLFSDLLVKMDIANMAHSLEGRSPFLCKELMEYAPAMNDNFKIKDTTTKYLLRKLSEKYLPPDLHHQPKRGFEIPLKKWVENDLNNIIQDYVGSASSLSREFIDPGFLANLLSGKAKVPAEKRAKMLWTLLSMEIWNSKVFKLS